MSATLNPPAAVHAVNSPRFERYAWGVLVYNMLVVLWGALVRATGSGAGCGNHWPLCNGEVVPRAPEIALVIEFTHRITSGLALISVIVLFVWARRMFVKGHRARWYAGLSVVFIIIEALLGAGLVLLQYVDKNASIGRAIYLSLHLANTQVLLGVIALTAWYARHAARSSVRPLVAWSLPIAIVVGVSGAIAALGDTLFPATSFAEGVRQEMSSTAHFLLRLRVFHPVLALLSAGWVAFMSMRVIRMKLSTGATKIAWWAWGLMFVQLVAGGINVLLLAPVWMQIVHLLLADILWVALVLLTAETARELPERAGI